jgi:hypothetical protein
MLGSRGEFVVTNEMERSTFVISFGLGGGIETPVSLREDLYPDMMLIALVGHRALMRLRRQ